VTGIAVTVDLSEIRAQRQRLADLDSRLEATRRASSTIGDAGNSTDPTATSGAADSQARVLPFEHQDDDSSTAAPATEQSPSDPSVGQQQSPGPLTAKPLEFEWVSRGREHVPDPRSRKNVQVALIRMNVQLAYNEFDYRVYARFHKKHVLQTVPLDDALEVRLWLNTLTYFKFLPTREFFSTVLVDEAHSNTYHPVREYLNGLVWDATPRLDRWLIASAGAADTPFIQAVSAIVLIAAVRRVRQPGCKFDEILVLESPQGWNKSMMIEVLCPDATWFGNSFRLTLSEKELIEQTAGKWLIEVPELSGMSGAEVEHLKALLSRGTDSSRLAYGRHRVDRPRQFIIVGTTNDTEYLRDMTGNRRFWPVQVQQVDLEAIRRDRDQLWAEAAAREAAAESIRLPEHLWQAAADEQEQRRVNDPWEDELKVWLAGKTRESRREIFTWLGKDPAKATKLDGMRLRQVMERLGWRKMTVSVKGRIEVGYGK
jgi:predicted P-loop ATPase